MSARAWARALCLALPFLPVLAIQPAQAGGPSMPQASSSTFYAAMQSAAQARQVPLPLIEAISYVNTRWEWITTPAMGGGVGPMDVRPSQIALASSLSGLSQAQIAGDPASNLDAGAALLAHYHTSGTDLTSWQPAVVATQGPLVAQQIYDALQIGASRTTSTGETITLAPQPTASTSPNGPTSSASVAPNASAAAASTATTTDYALATWVPADPSNYSVANRAHDYPIDMVIIHDVEGTDALAIQLFQTPGYAASAHYVVGYQGQITQMVREKDIAWHAGNWDYNTRSIGIEHAGYASSNLYTTAEYNASAALAASICSRWGVPMDRTHVIGHDEVPDPNNAGLFGGSDHHTDPGPYWDWTYYMATAQADAAKLTSPPHLMPDPVATNTATGATVTWQPARTCHTPISGYTVTSQPGSVSMTLPATATSATFSNLQIGIPYTFTVTAQNTDGHDSQVTNAAIPGACTGAGLSASPASPQNTGTTIQLTATSATCANPQYRFWVLPPGGAWTVVQDYSPSATFNWDTAGLTYGSYSLDVWARDSSSPGSNTTSVGTYDARLGAGLSYTLTPPPCTATSVTASPTGVAMVGMAVTLTATATGCSSPQYEFWVQSPNGAWSDAQLYSPNATFRFSTAGQPAGSYRFSVWSRATGGAGINGTSPNTYDSFSAFPYALTAGCPSMTATASPASTAGAGTTVTVTAAAPGCPNPRYQFWLLPPGGTWTVLQQYSPNATLTWNTTGWPGGSYRFSVWARDASSGASYDTFSAFQYTLTTTPCTAMNASASPASSAGLGTVVTVTGAASGCPNPQYEFWLLPPGGTWAPVLPYSSKATFTWSTSGKAAGSYRFSVWARDGGSSSSYDAFSAFQYSLTSIPCTGMSPTTSPASSASVGTTVTVTGSATGCPSPLYEFWLLPPGGTWTLVVPYSTSATFTWSTVGKPAGSYRFSVWARDTSSPGTSGTAPNTYDSFSAFQYSLT